MIGSGAAFGALWLLIAPAAASVTSQAAAGSASQGQPANQGYQPAGQAPAPQQNVSVPQPYQPPVLRTRRS